MITRIGRASRHAEHHTRLPRASLWSASGSAMPALPSDLAAELLKYTEQPPPTRRGHPGALRGRRLRQFLKALAETLSKNKILSSASRIAACLKKRTEYAKLSERTLRRYVETFIDYEIYRLSETPTADWAKEFGVLPPLGVI